MKTSVKQTLNLLGIAVLIINIWACSPRENNTEESLFLAKELFPEPSRPEGQSDVLELRCDPLETVRVAFIGVGGRGTGAVHRFTFLEGVQIVALCSLEPEPLEQSQAMLKEKGLPEADIYTGPEDWKTICERVRKDPEAFYAA